MPTATTSSTTPRSRTPTTTRSTTSCSSSSASTRSSHRRLADPARRARRPPTASTRCDHLAPMGSLEKVTTDEALEKWADDVRKRLGTDEPVAYVIEPKIDGSAISLVYENGCLRARRDPRRRRPGRGRDGEPAHDRGDPAAHPARRRRGAAAAARGARRGVLPAHRLRALQRGADRHRARSPRRTRATRPPARCGS